MSAKPEPKAPPAHVMVLTQGTVKIFDCPDFSDDDGCKFSVVKTDWTCDKPGTLVIGGEQDTNKCQLLFFDVGGYSTTGSLVICPVTSGTIRLTRLRRGVPKESGGSDPGLARISMTRRDDFCVQVEPIKILQARAIPNLPVRIDPRADGGWELIYGQVKLVPDVVSGQPGKLRDKRIPGINFEATLCRPERGDLRMLQTCTGYRRFTSLSGKSFNCDTGKGAFLDTELPLSAVKPKEGDQAGTVTLAWEDSPGTDLPANCKKVEVSERFRTYLTCGSKGGKWITFACAEWFWEATASRADAQSPWKLTHQSACRGKPFNFTKTSEQPSWNGNVTLLEAASRQALRDPDHKDDGEDRKDGGKEGKGQP